EVIVNSRHFKATGKKAGHHRSDFLIEQHQVAHEHRAVTRLLEGGVRSQRETGLDGYALDRDVEIRARHADAIDVAGLHLTRLAQRLLDSLPVRIGRPDASRCGHDDNDTEPDGKIFDLA